MEGLDYWRLCDELNIVQAALLVVGEDPSISEYAESWELDKRPMGYEATKTAICGALKKYIQYQEAVCNQEMEFENFKNTVDSISSPEFVLQLDDSLLELRNGSIEGILIAQTDSDMFENLVAVEGTIDLYKSKVNVESLKKWLRLKGFTTGFFFPELTVTMDFLDPHNSRYAPKLAASVKAWQAVTDAGSKSPKQALDKWLREHASQFGLANDDGTLIETAIAECSKVANWNAKGGATKTPSKPPLN